MKKRLVVMCTGKKYMIRRPEKPGKRLQPTSLSRAKKR